MLHTRYKGTLFFEWNELDAAEQHVQKAISLARQIADPGLMPHGYVGLARVMQARREIEQATELFSQAVAQAQHSGRPRLLAQAQAYQVRWWLLRGEMEAVARWQAGCAWTSGDWKLL